MDEIVDAIIGGLAGAISVAIVAFTFKAGFWPILVCAILLRLWRRGGEVFYHQSGEAVQGLAGEIGAGSTGLSSGGGIRAMLLRVVWT